MSNYGKSIDAIDVKIHEQEEQLLKSKFGSDEYTNAITSLTDLYSLKELKNNSKEEVEPKVKDWGGVITSAIGFAGILAILGYEKTDVVASKAITMAQKMIGK